MYLPPLFISEKISIFFVFVLFEPVRSAEPPTVSWKTEFNISGEAFLTKPNSITYMIRDVVKKNTKINTKLSTTGGTSDARFIRKISPCLEFGLVGKTMHQIDESVSLKDLTKLTKIYQDILNKYFSWKL